MEKFQVWRLVTYAYLHGGILHILFNMMALLSLGSMLETRQGTFHFILSSYICLLISSVIHTLFLFGMFRGFGWLLSWYITPGVGYSGVLFAYLVLSIRYYPEARNICGFSIAPHLMPWLLLLVCQLIMWNVSFMGHLTGIIAGYVYFFILKIPAYRRVVFKFESVIPGFVRQIGSFKDMEQNGVDSVDGTNRFSQQQQGGFNLVNMVRDRFSSWRRSRSGAGQNSNAGGRRLGGASGSGAARANPTTGVAGTAAVRSPHPSTNAYSNLHDEEESEELYSLDGESPPLAPPPQRHQQQQMEAEKDFPGEGKRLGNG
eukprot:CAMPEP_0117444124 /NCGR_PEP_ID=MMETSP0759-20121206/5067_1 /TAXON_ID=63605 /ORGANISM="Percolomonas cosmopolitus, Strain WS" /LENGTH=315 /DNA_ID=CAMNT_0005236157 /DNA_START=412 /DNA_END=1359 /DNA_ORIENTATION=+